MRIGLLSGVLVGVLGYSAPVWAQVYPAEVTIAATRVEVRSGPTTKFYTTAELHQGDRVVVIREVKDQQGWLEIKPPKGSFSWVNAKYVKQIKTVHGTFAYIDAPVSEAVPALVGSALINARPNVQTKTGFIPGSIVLIVDQPLAVDGETWLPVQPDSREVRYIPADAIAPPTVVSTAAPANWALGTKANTPPTTIIPGHPGGAATDLKPVAGNTTSFSPTPNPSGTVAVPTTSPAQWSSYGVLRATTTLSRDGQPIYVLVDGKGQTLWYVATRPGTSLRTYVNRTISVYGSIVTRPDEAISVPYILASHIAVP